MTQCITYQIGPNFRARFYHEGRVEWTWNNWGSWTGQTLCPILYNLARQSLRERNMTQFMEVVG